MEFSFDKKKKLTQLKYIFIPLYEDKPHYIISIWNNL